MPISPFRRALNRRIPLTTLGWWVSALIVMAAIVALNILMDIR